MNCFGCGHEGHLERDCPNTGIDNGKLPWCGICDERTRLVSVGDIVARCQQCHPNRRKQSKQHRKCPTCHMTVYEWDHSPCGQHTGPDTPDRRPERQHIEQLVTAKGTTR